MENTGIELLGYESAFGKVTAVKRYDYFLPRRRRQVNEKPPAGLVPCRRIVCNACILWILSVNP
jgi:hypothetical protein